MIVALQGTKGMFLFELSSYKEEKGSNTEITAFVHRKMVK